MTGRKGNKLILINGSSLPHLPCKQNEVIYVQGGGTMVLIIVLVSNCRPSCKWIGRLYSGYTGTRLIPNPGSNIYIFLKLLTTFVSL